MLYRAVKTPRADIFTRVGQRPERLKKGQIAPSTVGSWLSVAGLAALSLIGLGPFAGCASAQTTFSVNTTRTDVDYGGTINSQTVDCTVNGAPCTLPSAIDQAVVSQQLTPPFTIILPAGTYSLTNINNRNDGVFGTTTDISIVGAGAASTIIDNGQSETRFIQIYGGTLSVSNLTIQNSSRYDYGGVFYGGGSGIVLNNVVMQGNSSGTWGGAIYTAGTTTITNSTFVNNSSCSGGALYLDQGSTTTITNTTFVGNTADCTGNTLTNNGTATLTNVTMLGDTAPGTDLSPTDLPSISNFGTLNLKSSLMAYNSAANCSNNSGNGTLISLGFNLDDDGTCGTEETDAQLGLNSNGLQNNGGPTPTVALQSGSVAIDYVGVSACPPPSTDQRGLNRPQGASCDAGAFEYTSLLFTSTTLSSSPNPSLYGQSVTLTANVSPSTATGTITFEDNGTPIASPITLNAGVATLPWSSFAGGSHAVTAVYSGNASYAGSTGALTQAVEVSTTTTLTSSANPSSYGQPITLTATVAPTTGTNVPGNGPV